MKRVLAFLTLSMLALGLSASAQEHETLFASPVDHGGFGGIVTKMTPIRGEMALMVGGYGGWLIDHRLMIGGGGYGLTSNVRANSAAEATYAPDGEPLYVELGYGGLMLEYIFTPHKLLHVNVQTLVGGGSVAYRENWNNNYRDENSNRRRYGPRESLFVAEPSVNVELNVTKWMRLSAGASYRYVSGVSELQGISNKDLSGPAGQFSLKFGGF